MSCGHELRYPSCPNYWQQYRGYLQGLGEMSNLSLNQEDLSQLQVIIVLCSSLPFFWLQKKDDSFRSVVGRKIIDAPDWFIGQWEHQYWPNLLHLQSFHLVAVNAPMALRARIAPWLRNDRNSFLYKFSIHTIPFPLQLVYSFCCFTLLRFLSFFAFLRSRAICFCFLRGNRQGRDDLNCIWFAAPLFDLHSTEASRCK